MTKPVKLDRRSVLKGVAGATLALPILETGWPTGHHYTTEPASPALVSVFGGGCGRSRPIAGLRDHHNRQHQQANIEDEPQ